MTSTSKRLSTTERAALAEMSNEGALFLAEWVRLLYRRREATLAYRLERAACEGTPMNQSAYATFVRSFAREMF